MEKDEQIKYLNQIKPFINLTAVCDDYNSKNNSAIDYNNLRAVLNGVSKTRLSEEKLDAFIRYLYQHLYSEIFKAYDSHPTINETAITVIAEKHLNCMKSEILKELQHELCSE